MSTEVSDGKGLHLPDLVVKGFRGIEDLTVSRLGRVNLISGRNGVGKTSLLDAVRVYAARGRYTTLLEVLRVREEIVAVNGYDRGYAFAPDWESLFHGRRISSDAFISIGPSNERDRIGIQADYLSEEELGLWESSVPEYVPDEDLRSLTVKFQDTKHEVPIVPGLTLPRKGIRGGASEIPSAIPCEIQGPGLPSNQDIARYWDRIALTDDESKAINALNLIFDDKVERAAIVNENGKSPLHDGRRAVVRMVGKKRPVSLKSLGDGAVRLFSVALALANSKDGFLLIDEVENGIRYSLQYDFWKMVMRAAYENNVQVFATTHSWDCVRGFSYAAMETEEVEGRLVRLFMHRKSGKIRAVEYSERDLQIAAEQGIEVR